jgi:hypothetical protein
MSTEEASISNTSLREWRTRSESVETTIPSSTGREQEGTRVRLPSTSTTHTRHTLTGVSVDAQHSVGWSCPTDRHASRMVAPAATSTVRPSMVR